MKLNLLAFGIAKDILEARAIVFELREGNTIDALKSALLTQFAAFNQLSTLAFAVNEIYVNNDFILHDGDEVVLIPPVSGG